MSSSDTPSRNSSGAFAALIFAVVSVLIFVGFCVWYWFQAPDTVASHINAEGQADDWSSKGSMLAILVPLGVGIPLLFSIRWIWEKLPTGLINIPQKEYWLEQGERAYLFDCLMEFMRIVGGLVALLFTAELRDVMHGTTESMQGWWTFAPTVVFLVATGLALWLLMHRLRPTR
jgi:uncharacterized membrane protein